MCLGLLECILPDSETLSACAIQLKANVVFEQNEKDKKEEKDLPPVKEADISQSKKDPSNSSGCVVS